MVHMGQRTELGKIADSIASQSKDKTKLEVCGAGKEVSGG